MEPTDRSAMRLSDAERHRVAEMLREAAGEGRIDVEELEERLEATYSAKTYADLVPITVDLPVPGGASPAPVREVGVAPRSGVPGLSSPPVESSFAMMSETRRKGVWTVPPTHGAVAVMGSVVLDLREAEFTARETVITANAIMGGVTIIVDAWTAVVVEGTGIMGQFTESRSRVAADLGPDSPVVRIKGFALMGEVAVKRKGEVGELRRRMLGH